MGSEESMVAAATAFGLAARAFTYPDEAFADAVASGVYGGAWREVATALDAGEAEVSQPQPVRRAPGAPVPADERDGDGKGDGAEADPAVVAAMHALRVEYTNTFLNMPHAVVSPYESVWKSEKREKTLVFANDIALAAKEAYRAAGFNPTGMTEPPDHVAYELGFVCELLRKGDATTAASFWEGRLADWIGPFCQAVRDVRGDGFYASLCAFLPRVLSTAVRAVA